MLTSGGEQTALAAIFKNKMKSNYVPSQQFTQRKSGEHKKKGKYIPFYARASWAAGFPHRGPSSSRPGAGTLSLSRRLVQAVLRASVTGLLSDRSALWCAGTNQLLSARTARSESPLGVRVCYVASIVSDSTTVWTVAHQAPLSMGFSRQEEWSGLPFPSPAGSYGSSILSF